MTYVVAVEPWADFASVAWWIKHAGAKRVVPLPICRLLICTTTAPRRLAVVHGVAAVERDWPPPHQAPARAA